MQRRLTLILVLAASGCGQQAAPKTGKPKRDAEALALGAKLYGEHCARCHGDAGKGDGKDAAASVPPPRDLTSGKFKYVSSPEGATEKDLYDLVREGLPGTTMQGFRQTISQYESWAVAYHVQKLAGLQGKLAKPLKVGLLPQGKSPDADRELYTTHCARCHGDKGLADGIAADTLVDDQGRKLPVRNLVRDLMRGGAEPEKLFLRIKLGMPGTPMTPPDAYPSLSDEQTWGIVRHVLALRAVAK